MASSTTHHAIAVTKKGASYGLITKPKPALLPDTVLVRVRAVSFNPTDWKHAILFLPKDASTGSDFAGDIVEIGEQATNSGFKVGDAVAGWIRGGFNSADNGAFQEYVRAYPDLIWHKPASLPYEVAAPLGGVAPTTVAQVFFHHLKLPTPWSPAPTPFPILIWAGSTGVGLYAIRIAKLSGLQVVTTSSPKNAALLKALGADAVFDYKDPETPAKIRAWSNGKIAHALDCISEHGSTGRAVQSLGTGPATLVTLVTLLATPESKGEVELPANVKVFASLLYNAQDKANKAEYDTIVDWNKRLPGIIEGGNLGVGSIPLKHWIRGIENIPDALKYVQDGRVSGEKLVLTL
jgi:NADPH:quinone reductase-like Zn-dependent oxidoreductase